MREALREAQEGRRKAEVEAAQLRVEVEGQWRRGDDLQQRLGVAEAHVRSLTSTLSASFTAQQGPAPQGLQSQGSGSRSGSQWLVGLLRGLPKGIFCGQERYGAQVDMCHFRLVGSGNPNPSNFRATHMAAATLRPALTPLVADLNGYCTSNAPPWFTWCSIQIVRPQGTDTMGLHSHLRDGAPMALIVCVGSFTGGEFWVESGGLLNPSMREKKRHTRVCKGRAVEGWACTATPQAPVLFNTRALYGGEKQPRRHPLLQEEDVPHVGHRGVQRLLSLRHEADWLGDRVGSEDVLLTLPHSVGGGGRHPHQPARPASPPHPPAPPACPPLGVKARGRPPLPHSVGAGAASASAGAAGLSSASAGASGMSSSWGAGTGSSAGSASASSDPWSRGLKLTGLCAQRRPDCSPLGQKLGGHHRNTVHQGALVL